MGVTVVMLHAYLVSGLKAILAHSVGRACSMSWLPNCLAIGVASHHHPQQDKA